jgi:hypothetical protein
VTRSRFRSGGLEACGDEPDAARQEVYQEVYVHLQEVVIGAANDGAGGQQLQKVEEDAPALPRLDREKEKDTCWLLMVLLDALARGTCLDELVDCRRQPRPPS